MRYLDRDPDGNALFSGIPDYRTVVAPGWVEILEAEQVTQFCSRWQVDRLTEPALSRGFRRTFVKWTEELEPGHHPIPKQFLTFEPNMSQDYSALLNCMAYPADPALDLRRNAFTRSSTLRPVSATFGSAGEYWVTPTGETVQLAVEYLDESLPYGTVRIGCYNAGARKFVRIMSPETYRLKGSITGDDLADMLMLEDVSIIDNNEAADGFGAWLDSLTPGDHLVPAVLTRR